MLIDRKPFGVTRAGGEAFLYTLQNDRGMRAVVSNYGAVLVSLVVPGPDGAPRDVVFGYDRLEDYERPGFFGATVGRNANRIAGAAFTLDGKEYRLCDNDGGNNLHSDFQAGFHKQLWQARPLPDGVLFSRLSPDGECGFPGNVQAQVSYRLLPGLALEIRYEAVSDRKTILNFTNHSFFNLAGHGAGSVLQHTLRLDADRFVEIGEGRIPTGRLLPVAGTPMDFTRPKAIGRDIEQDHRQLHLACGYDHTWALDTQAGSPRRVARVEAPDGMAMELSTDLPGVQFYTANFIRPQNGKGGAVYGPRGALCLETQYFPDNIHHPNFRQSVFSAGEPYRAQTVYRFFPPKG